MYLKDEFDDPAAFKLVLHWLYKGFVPPVTRKDAMRKLPLKDMEDKGVLLLLATYHRLYYMAEKWCSESLRDAVLYQIRVFHSTTAITVHLKQIIEGFMNSSESSPLRQYLLEACTRVFKTGDRFRFPVNSEELHWFRNGRCCDRSSWTMHSSESIL